MNGLVGINLRPRTVTVIMVTYNESKILFLCRGVRLCKRRTEKLTGQEGLCGKLAMLSLFCLVREAYRVDC